MLEGNFNTFSPNRLRRTNFVIGPGLTQNQDIVLVRITRVATDPGDTLTGLSAAIVHLSVGYQAES